MISRSSFSLCKVTSGSKYHSTFCQIWSAASVARAVDVSDGSWVAPSSIAGTCGVTAENTSSPVVRTPRLSRTSARVARSRKEVGDLIKVLGSRISVGRVIMLSTASL